MKLEPRPGQIWISNEDRNRYLILAVRNEESKRSCSSIDCVRVSDGMVFRDFTVTHSNLKSAFSGSVHLEEPTEEETLLFTKLMLMGDY